LESVTLIWLFFMVCLSVAACQTTVGETAIPSETPTPATGRTTTPEAEWAHFTFEDIRLALEIPHGWEADTDNEGIVLAEHMGSMETGGVLDGVQVHCFVHPVDELAPPEQGNRAVQILNRILANPSYINPNDSVSSPQGFTWDRYDAAYYLLNDGDYSLKMLLALAISSERLVVCSITAPWRQEARIRPLVPRVLNSLTVNGHRLDGASLDEIPDPLEFPDYSVQATAEAP
jgi:hypothetical protein